MSGKFYWHTTQETNGNMLDRTSPRLRPKRKVSVNIQLSKQDLQEYLDDGYTAAGIAKDFSVSPAVITEKIRKFGVKKKKQTNPVKKRGRPTSPKKQKRLKPQKIQSTPRKGKAKPKAESTPSKKGKVSKVKLLLSYSVHKNGTSFSRIDELFNQSKTSALQLCCQVTHYINQTCIT